MKLLLAFDSNKITSLLDLALNKLAFENKDLVFEFLKSASRKIKNQINHKTVCQSALNMVQDVLS